MWEEVRRPYVTQAVFFIYFALLEHIGKCWGLHRLGESWDCHVISSYTWHSGFDRAKWKHINLAISLCHPTVSPVCVRPEHKKKRKRKKKKRSNNAAGVAYLSQQFDVLLFDWIHNSRFQEDLALKLKGAVFRGLDLTERSAWCVFIVNVFGFIVSMPLKYS